MIAIAGISAAVTVVLSIPFPAAGATAFYTPTQEMLSGFSPHSGIWHMAVFSSLRGGDPVLDYNHLAGVIQFPSYHAAIAIFLTYALRGTVLFVPAIFLNALMILGTLPEGGHHLIDVIAGSIICVASILLVRELVRRGARRRQSAQPEDGELIRATPA
jgi:membrane-associated phospholipid phosphatase